MNMNALMQQAQRMQKDMQKKQAEIYATDYEGHSELVDIILTGEKKIKSITIKNKDKLDSEDLEILEDMIKIAFNDALSKIETDFNSKMGPYAKMANGLM